MNSVAPFDVRLVQYGKLFAEASSVGDGDQPPAPSVAFTRISWDTLQKLAAREQVSAHNMPLTALQRKIGERGRFCLPDASLIDDTATYSLDFYRRYLGDDIALPIDKVTDREILHVFYLLLDPVDNNAQDTTKGGQNVLPITEKDWDYIFQANSILNCYLIDPEKATFKKAPLAGFRLRNASEDDVELPMPLDDDRAKIPVWVLSTKPGRTHIVETKTVLEQSAVESSNQKESWNIGLGATFQDVGGKGDIGGEAKYERSKEMWDKTSETNTSTNTTMNMVREAPTVEISLHAGNTRLSEGCRQALLQLRAQKKFDDLLNFFNNYGTIYAKRVVLGGRLVASRQYQDDSHSQSIERERNFKDSASLSLNILVASVSGGYSKEQGWASNSTTKSEQSQKTIDWTTYGGNAAYSADPQKWSDSLSDFRYWEVIENAEVESVQAFIGRIPGYDDIPGLFDSIMHSGLLNQQLLRLSLGCHPTQMVSKPDFAKYDLGVGVSALGVQTGTTTTTFLPTPFQKWDAQTSEETEVTVPGGISWRLLDSGSAIYGKISSTVEEEIASTIQTLTNTGTNLRSLPLTFYKLTMAPKTLTVVLDWSTDTVRTRVRGIGEAGQANLPSQLSQNIGQSTLPGVQDKVQTIRAAMNSWKASDPIGQTDEFANQAGNVSKCVADLVEVLPQYSPLQTWAAQRRDVLSLAVGDVVDWAKKLKALQPSKDPTFVENQTARDAVMLIRGQVSSIINDRPGVDGIVYNAYNLTADASTTIASSGAAFMAKYGHRFVSGYSEVGKLSAVWQLAQDPGAHTEDVLKFRLQMQRYFTVSRSVEEVCDYFAAMSEHPDQGIKVSVSVFSPIDSATGQPVPGITPLNVGKYLQKNRLRQNIVRSSYELKPYSQISVSFIGALSHWQEVLNVSPDQRLVTSLAKALSQLTILNAYVNEPTSGITKDQLTKCWNSFNDLEQPKSMDTNGNITQTALTGLDTLITTLKGLIESAVANVAKGNKP